MALPRRLYGWNYRTAAMFLLFCGTIAYAYNGDPPLFVDVPPPLKIAREGHSLLLKCRATGRPEPVTTWRKDGRLVKDGQDGILLSRGDGDLAVPSLTTAHRGKYTCLAQSVEGQIRFTTQVKVQAPPELVKRPWDLTTQEGRDAMFDCSAKGYPTNMKYRWTYNDDPVESSEHLRGRFSVLADGSLIIYNIKTSDRGNVSCTADNGFGTSPTVTASLHVQFRARVTRMPAIAYAGLGLKAILRCPSEAEPPVNKVVWRKGSRRVSPYQDSRITMTGDGSLIIEPANSSDGGRYTCTPYNIHGTLGESTATELRVRDPPYFTRKLRRVYEAELGESLTVPCEGEGDPPPAVRWRKVAQSAEAVQYGVELGTLTIDPVTKAIHGTWQCVLTNSVAEVVENVEIHVKYTIPHQVQNVTAIAISDSAIRVEWVPGYNGGYPQSFIVWYRQAGETDPSWQTYHIGALHGSAAVLDKLVPGTAYEVAVLPENRIRSGLFSDTVIAKTKASRPLINAIAPSLPAPHALYSSTTDEGLIQLSWRMTESYLGHKNEVGTAIPLSKGRRKIWGFLVEFRCIATAVDEQKERAKRAAKMPVEGQWEALTVTHENVTALVVGPDLLYRDLNYEFRVLAATDKEYSPPSTPVSFSTKGLTAYPCYVAPIHIASVFDRSIIAGILVAVILMLLAVGFLLFCFCRRRLQRRQRKADVASEEAATDDRTLRDCYTVDGHVIAKGNDHPTVVHLTEKGPIGKNRTMEKQEHETETESDEAKTPLIENNNNDIEEAGKIFSDFLARRSSSFDSDSRKETLSSDRSSVRLRRETATRVLTEQYKRRSLSDHTYRRMYRGIPFRGGTRSASTSPERNCISDNLNATDVWEDLRGRKRIRLYSRPIDDSGSAQQRRMIVIKRKSLKIFGLEAGRNASTGAPPSDSSESPVFGVVGTMRRSSAGNSIDGGRARMSHHTATIEASSRDDVISSNINDHVILRKDCPSSPLLRENVSAFSPRNNSSPEVSPNRVVARRTVEYDPKVDPAIPSRPSYLRSPSKWDSRCDESNFRAHEHRGLSRPSQSRCEDRKLFYPYLYSDEADLAPVPQYYRDPGFHMVPTGTARTRYSFAHYPQRANHVVSPPDSALHRPTPGNDPRSRASCSFHHHRPVALYSPPPAVYDHRSPPSAGGGRCAQPSSSEPWSPQPPSTCEIDCSNSDIEVRFFKDPGDNQHSLATSSKEVSTAGPVARPPSTAATRNLGSVLAPSRDNANIDKRTARTRSSVAKTFQEQHSTSSAIPQTLHGGRGQSRTRSLSAAGQATHSPPRHVKLKSADGSDGAPTSPSLGAVGSSDYGSQDTSNSSASPHVITSGLGPSATFQSQFPATLAQDRPPRARDNSSVEDNYEWDSEIAMESEILEALRHFGTLKKSGPVSDELLDELHKFTNDAKNSLQQRQRARSADMLESRTNAAVEAVGERGDANQNSSFGPIYSYESMARRCAALRAEFLHYRRLQQLDEDGVT